MTATWIETTREITSGDRQRDYGRPLINFVRQALVENIYDAGRRTDLINPMDVAQRLVALKQVRQLNTHKDDNWIDTMGYSACVDDMNRHMTELGYQDGVRALRTMSIQQMFDLLVRLVLEQAG